MIPMWAFAVGFIIIITAYTFAIIIEILIEKYEDTIK